MCRVILCIAIKFHGNNVFVPKETHINAFIKLNSQYETENIVGYTEKLIKITFI